VVTAQGQAALVALMPPFLDPFRNYSPAIRTDLTRALGSHCDNELTSFFRFVSKLSEQLSPSRVQDGFWEQPPLLAARRQQGVFEGSYHDAGF
jgi:hypothetical protein